MDSRGFTLLELVVALGVFAVIGLISAQLLSHSITVTDKVLERSAHLIEIQRAVSTIQRDIEQHAGRSIRNRLGDFEQSIELRSDTELELTRNGWSNPLGQHRSNLQRVSFHVVGDELVRRFWYVLDRPTDPISRDQVLLSGVSSLTFNVIDDQDQKHSFWPVRTGGEVVDGQPIIAITVSMGTLAFGEFTWLVNIPEVPTYRPVHVAPEQPE